MTDAASLEAPRRLHPMTLLQRLLVSLPGFIFLLLPVLRHPNRDAWLALVLSVVYGVVALPWIVLYYQRFRYSVTPKELIIQSGVLTRQHRNIPIERIHNIEIEQTLLPRLLGTAKVKVETAGSTSAEGVLEYVGLQEAHRIRAAVRAYQRLHAEDTSPEPTTAAEPPQRLLFAMPSPLVLRAGAYRFSVIYIAIILSVFQYWEPDPAEIADWIARGRFEPLVDAAAESPWLAAIGGLALAIGLSWFAGIAVTFNRYYNFRLWREAGKLHKRHGLLTVLEGTIPLKKVQALILRTNPLMRRFGWYQLKLQTMGVDNKRGHQVAIPFDQLGHILTLAPQIHPFTMPEAFLSVSRLTIRRATVRYTALLLLIVLPLAYFWTVAWWGLLAFPLGAGLAYLQYRNHGYAVEDGKLYVRRGVFRQRIWILPVEKFQVFYAEQSIFQRRLGLKTLHVDTAGASTVAGPDVIDLPADEADALLEALYAGFRMQFERRAQDIATDLADPASRPTPENDTDAPISGENGP